MEAHRQSCNQNVSFVIRAMKKLLCLASDSDDDVDEVVRVGMVRLSVGMQLEVPTTDLTSVRDPFEDTNRLHFQH